MYSGVKEDNAMRQVCIVKNKLKKIKAYWVLNNIPFCKLIITVEIQYTLVSELVVFNTSAVYYTARIIVFCTCITLTEFGIQSW